MSSLPAPCSLGEGRNGAEKKSEIFLSVCLLLNIGSDAHKTALLKLKQMYEVNPMKKKDISILIDGFRRLSADDAKIAELLSGTETTSKNAAEVQAETEPEATATEENPTKVYTLKEVRGILSDKARSGFRAEVKALLTSH